jgi:hypothetical protein
MLGKFTFDMVAYCESSANGQFCRTQTGTNVFSRRTKKTNKRPIYLVDEWDILRSQIVTANKNISKVKFLPYVFTEHGVLMLSNVLILMLVE